MLRTAFAGRTLAFVVPLMGTVRRTWLTPRYGRSTGEMMLKTFAISLALAVAAAAPLSAQGNGTKAGKIPPGQRPPAGMCRIWLDGVPPGQQPAPTDCATAVRNRPANGRVIFGDDYVDGKTKKLNGNADDRRTAPREDRVQDRIEDRDRSRADRGNSQSDDENDERRDRKAKSGSDDSGKRATRKARPRDTTRTIAKPQ